MKQRLLSRLLLAIFVAFFGVSIYGLNLAQFKKLDLSNMSSEELIHTANHLSPQLYEDKDVRDKLQAAFRHTIAAGLLTSKKSPKEQAKAYERYKHLLLGRKNASRMLDEAILDQIWEEAKQASAQLNSNPSWDIRGHNKVKHLSAETGEMWHLAVLNDNLTALSAAGLPMDSEMRKTNKMLSSYVQDIIKSKIRMVQVDVQKKFGHRHPAYRVIDTLLDKMSKRNKADNPISQADATKILQLVADIDSLVSQVKPEQLSDPQYHKNLTTAIDNLQTKMNETYEPDKKTPPRQRKHSSIKSRPKHTVNVDHVHETVHGLGTIREEPHPIGEHPSGDTSEEPHLMLQNNRHRDYTTSRKQEQGNDSANYYP